MLRHSFFRDALEQIKCGKRSPVSAYVQLLQECGSFKDLVHGKLVHAHIAENGFGSSAFLGDHLVQMYGKCGSLKDAEQVFGRLQPKNIFSYNFMLGAYAQNGHRREALELLQRMEEQGLKADAHTYSRLVGAFASPCLLAEARAVHHRISKHKCQMNDVVENAIMNMYAKCGSVEDARKVFDGMVRRSVVSWNCMITAYTQKGHFAEAFGLFEAMGMQQPNATTFVCVLATCAGLADITKGKMIHDRVVSSGLGSAVKVQNALVSMYSKCGRLDVAERVFGGIEAKDVVSWNTIIAAYTQNGLNKLALKMFRVMDLEGASRDMLTFQSILSACEELEDCRKMHSRVVRSGFSLDLQVALVAMYGRAGHLADARVVFDGIQPKDFQPACTVMISAYVQQGRTTEALELYRDMRKRGVDPEILSFPSLVRACSSLAEVWEIHEHAVATGSYETRAVKNALVSMYAECNCFEQAKQVFDGIQDKDYVSWTAMLTAHAQLGHLDEALQVFEEMEEAGAEPSAVTFAMVLGACCGHGYLPKGRRIHQKIMEAGLDSTLMVQNALINMYGKCGSVHSAKSVFDRMLKRNVISWTAFVAANAENGHHREAMVAFSEMALEGVQANSVTFTVVLVTCGQAGLVEDGQMHFYSISSDYGQIPTVEHVGCLIDLLGRVGRLEEAEEVTKGFLGSDNVAWKALLSACKMHCNTKLGGRAADHASGLAPDDNAPFLLLSNIHAELGHKST